MKNELKVMKNYRLRPDLVKSINDLSERLECTKTNILETALEKLIKESLFESHK